MKASVFVLVVGSMTLAASFATAGAQQAAPASASVGVYSAEQATRGQAAYVFSCKDCHGPALAGGDLAPPLAGKDFVARWRDFSVGDLFDKVSTSMPPNAPGSLKLSQYADALAYILNVNKYPPGAAELPAEATPLQSVRMGPPPQ